MRASLSETSVDRYVALNIVLDFAYALQLTYLFRRSSRVFKYSLYSIPRNEHEVCGLRVARVSLL